jgi:hypothetical protein
VLRRLIDVLEAQSEARVLFEGKSIQSVLRDRRFTENQNLHSAYHDVSNGRPGRPGNPLGARGSPARSPYGSQSRETYNRGPHPMGISTDAKGSGTSRRRTAPSVGTSWKFYPDAR